MGHISSHSPCRDTEGRQSLLYDNREAVDELDKLTRDALLHDQHLQLLHSRLLSPSSMTLYQRLLSIQSACHPCPVPCCSRWSGISISRQDPPWVHASPHLIIPTTSSSAIRKQLDINAQNDGHGFKREERLAPKRPDKQRGRRKHRSLRPRRAEEACPQDRSAVSLVPCATDARRC
jgi:hypothetical protein